MLRAGPRAIALMHHFEQCRLEAYRCPAGVPTIGWGCTFYPGGRPVRIGDRLSQREADELFRNLLATVYEPVVRGLIGAAPTTPAQFGALVSFAYNVGTDDDLDRTPEGLGDSTLLARHRAGDHAGAADEFPRWNKAKGRALPGLTRRRRAERALYLGDFAAVERLTTGAVRA